MHRTHCSAHDGYRCDRLRQYGRVMNLRTLGLLLILFTTGYFAWERHSAALDPSSIPVTRPVVLPRMSPAPEVPKPAATDPAKPTKQYMDVVRYLTADGKFGMTDDQSKVPSGARILSLEQKEVHAEQRVIEAHNVSRPETNPSASTPQPAESQEENHWRDLVKRKRDEYIAAGKEVTNAGIAR